MVKQNKQGSGMLARLSAQAGKAVQSDSPNVQIPLDRVVFDLHQPRQSFHAVDGIVAPSDQLSLEELAASIKSHGLIHPITVSEQPDGRYLVRVGERRTRACMLNGATTILGRVRNDLDGVPALALQLAENTDRQNLSDREIADTIARLLTKTEDNPKPMSKADVARLLGKSAGWVTRYLTFGNEIQRQKWVAPGYVETPEVLYLLTLLPEDIQEIVYADLSTGRIAPPLRSRQVEYYKGLAKRKAESEAEPDEAEKSGSAAQGTEGDAEGFVWPFAAQGEAAAAGVAPVSAIDAIAVAMQGGGVVDGTVRGGDGAVAGARESESAAQTEGSVVSGDGYQLPESVAQGLRVPTYTTGSEGGSATVLRTQSAVMANSAVPCRVPMGVLGNLISLYGAKMGMSKLDAEVRFPSAMAVDLVRELTGETVEGDKVSVLLARALEALR